MTSDANATPIQEKPKVDYVKIIQSLATLVTVGSVVVGAIISIGNYKETQVKDAEAREMEASKSFIELRQKRYLETLQKVETLVMSNKNRDKAYDSARNRFEDLYWGDLALVEDVGVDTCMSALKQLIDEHDNLLDTLQKLSSESYLFLTSYCSPYLKLSNMEIDTNNEADYRDMLLHNSLLALSHAMRNSLFESWKVDSSRVGKVYN